MSKKTTLTHAVLGLALEVIGRLTILDFANKFLAPPARATGILKCPLKFHVDLIYCLKLKQFQFFLTFDLKLPKNTHFFMVRATDNQKNFLLPKPSKAQKAHPWVNLHRFENPSTHFCCRQ